MESQSQHSDWTHRFTALFKWLVNVSDEETIQNREIINSQIILGIALIIMVSFAIIYQLVTQETPLITFWLIILMLILYGISRTRWYFISSLGFLSLLLLLPYFMIALRPESPQIIFAILGSILAVPVAAYALRTRDIIITTIIEILSLMWVATNISYVSPLIAWGSVTVSFSLAALTLLRRVTDSTAQVKSLEHKNLQEELERYRTIFDMMSDYGYILQIVADKQYKFLWASNAYEVVTGYNPKLVDANIIIDNLIYEDDLPITQYHLAQLHKGEVNISEHRILSKQGAVRWVREYAYPVLDEAGKLSLIYGSVRDITDTVASEESLKNHALQQAVVAELGVAAMTGRVNETAFLTQAINLIAQVLNVPWCVLMEYQSEPNKFVIYSAIGKLSEKDEIESYPNDTRTFLGYVLNQDDPIVVKDWSREHRFKPIEAFKSLGIKTSLSVIVQGQEKPFGVLNIHDSEFHNFTGDDINFLQAVANVIGAYLSQIRTRIAEHEQRIMAEALRDTAAILNSQHDLKRILDTILQLVYRVVPVFDEANIMLIDREKGVARITTRHYVNDKVLHAGSGQEMALDDVPTFMEMMRSGQPVSIPDVTKDPHWFVVPETDWIRSYLSAPIYAGGEWIGVLNLDSASTNSFTSKHIDSMKAFLNQASIAIQNARRSEDLEQQVQERTKALQAERAQLQAILNATGEGVFYAEDNIIHFLNDALCDITGYTSDELSGNLSTMFRPPDISQEQLDKIAELRQVVVAGKIWRGELLLCKKDGTRFTAGMTISRVGEYDGKVRRSVTVMRDISKEKLVHEEQERFIARAAHELRTPVTNLNTRVYIMRKKNLDLGEDMHKLEQVIKRMSHLVEDLLDLSRYQRGQITLSRKDTILQTVLSDVIDIQSGEAETKQITLQYEALEDPVHVIADENRLAQVFTNLVYNAINYTSENGQVTVKLYYPDDTHNEIAIDVIDNGIGIDKPSMDSLFQPFFRASNNPNRGTGLGLSISKQIVEMHGGHIEVESEENKGSRFTVFLPPTFSDDSSLNLY